MGRIIRKNVIFTAIASLALVLIGQSSLAAPSVMKVLENAGTAAKYDTAKNDLSSMVGNIIFAALSLLGVVFLGFTIYAGYLWMTARGEQSQVQKARDILSNSLIGLIIIVGAYAITYFVLYYMTQGLLTSPGL